MTRVAQNKEEEEEEKKEESKLVQFKGCKSS